MLKSDRIVLVVWFLFLVLLATVWAFVGFSQLHIGVRFLAYLTPLVFLWTGIVAYLEETRYVEKRNTRLVIDELKEKHALLLKEAVNCTMESLTLINDIFRYISEIKADKKCLISSERGSVVDALIADFMKLYSGMGYEKTFEAYEFLFVVISSLSDSQSTFRLVKTRNGYYLDVSKASGFHYCYADKVSSNENSDSDY